MEEGPECHSIWTNDYVDLNTGSGSDLSSGNYTQWLQAAASVNQG